MFSGMEAFEETGTSGILSDPRAEELLEDARLSAAAVRGCAKRLTGFVQRYLPLFYRVEQRENAVVVLEGLLSGLQRKTCEPIAREHGVHRKPIQAFVGHGAWDDDKVIAELHRHVKTELADPGAVLVIDPSSFIKKGTESCGVKRQWCGRLGKTENCQVGVFLCYAADGGHAPLDRQLYLPQDWASDADRRKKCHVPEEVIFQEKWRIGLAMLDRCRNELPHAWVAADDEMGRCTEFRDELRLRKERYVVDVPCNTLVRDLEAPRPRRKRAGRGRKRETPFVSVKQWMAKRPASAWQRVEVRPGTKGPLVVEAMTRRVQTRRDKHRLGPEERLLVKRTVVEGCTKIDYSLSNAGPEIGIEDLVRGHAQRYRIEQMLAEGKGSAGLGHYEVRSWVGWHHHMTLSMLALWFLVSQQIKVGGKNLPGSYHAADPANLFMFVA
jgi:SRSO17 transposase